MTYSTGTAALSKKNGHSMPWIMDLANYSMLKTKPMRSHQSELLLEVEPFLLNVRDWHWFSSHQHHTATTLRNSKRWHIHAEEGPLPALTNSPVESSPNSSGNDTHYAAWNTASSKRGRSERPLSASSAFSIDHGMADVLMATRHCVDWPMAT